MPDTHPRISTEEKAYIKSKTLSKQDHGSSLPFPPFKQIFTCPAFHALILVHFGHNWGLNTLLTEIPTYLNNVQHFSLKAVIEKTVLKLWKSGYFLFFLQNGFLSALPYFLMWICSMPMGLIADWLIQSKRLSTKNVRRLFNCIGHYGSALGLLGLAFTGCDKTAAVVWLCVSVGLNGAVYSAFQAWNHDLICASGARPKAERSSEFTFGGEPFCLPFFVLPGSFGLAPLAQSPDLREGT